LLDRFIELRLPAAGDEDLGSSATKRWAVARLILLLLPVITPAFPSSFFVMGLILGP
jgi:hypothetical protein